MVSGFISLVAKVECRSEGRGDEIPVAVVIGRERIAVVEVLDRAVVTGVSAGEPVRHRYWVALEDGRRCRLTRIEPAGDWRVNIQSSNP